jgi:hypothetical protein
MTVVRTPGAHYARTADSATIVVTIATAASSTASLTAASCSAAAA